MRSRPQFIEWLERKLTEHLGRKRLVPTNAILADAYRRALAVAQLNRAIEESCEAAIQNAHAATIPRSLRRQLEKSLRDSPRAWDTACTRSREEACFLVTAPID